MLLLGFLRQPNLHRFNMRPVIRANDYRGSLGHQCHVTQPLLREQLLEWGIDVSVGQIDALLSVHNEALFAG